MANKFETLKEAKDGLALKDELASFAAMGWEAIPVDDREHRLKWLGVFWRKRTPGEFMMRLRVAGGYLSSEQLRLLATIINAYGEKGVADITTRQNIQLRGIAIEDVPEIMAHLRSVGLTSVQSGMDNVRNITASPLSGLDPNEVIDVRVLAQAVQDAITNYGEGNPAYTNLPRKFNIAVLGCRDNSVHAEINDLAFVPAIKDGVTGFNVLVGGFFSARRCAEAIPLDVWVAPDQVVAVCEVVLQVYRDHGPRNNRQKSRLMWLLDEWGVPRFRAELETRLAQTLATAAPAAEITESKRELLGLIDQKEPELVTVGLHVPVGRLHPGTMFGLADLAERYGTGELRLTVEQNALLPNVSRSRLEALFAEPLLQTFSPTPGWLERGLVSCTGSQFCGFALIETKNRAIAMIRALETELELSRPVRIHWTGCPNSCGQPQVADIGLMGAAGRKDGKSVEAVDIYMGGEVGKDAQLGECIRKGVPCEDLQPVLRELLISHFAAQPRASVEA